MPIDNILLVDDDPSTIQLLARILTGAGNLRFATSGDDALRLAREAPPDLVLLDAEMPGMSGFDVCASLKADPALAEVPVIFVTSHTEASFELAGFGLGAVDFIAKPVSPPLVQARVKTHLRLKRMADELRRVATEDALTGLANRRRFDERLAMEWSRARRCGDALALLMIDVDHFKQFNDSYGHPAGDACLHSVARALAACTARPADLAARYGGEEFALLLPQTAREGALHVAHNVLAAVTNLAIPHAASLAMGHVSVSIGVGGYDADSACWRDPSAESRHHTDFGGRCSAAQLLQAADHALYAAKRGGRARAAVLDVADADTPALARVLPPSRLR